MVRGVLCGTPAELRVLAERIRDAGRRWSRDCGESTAPRYGAFVLLTRRVLDGIARGEISLAFRSWDRPRVRPGTRLRTAIGVVAVDSVTEVDPAAIEPSEAGLAGYADPAELHAALAKYARGADRPVFRIALRFAGEDPRIALRARADLTEDEIAALLSRLRRLDQASRHGPWTTPVLRLIADRPAVRAVDLAAELGRQKCIRRCTAWSGPD